MKQTRVIHVAVGDDGGGPWVFTRELTGGLAKELHDRRIPARFIIDGRHDERGFRNIVKRVNAKHKQAVVEWGFVRPEKLLWLPRDKENLVEPEALPEKVLKEFGTNFDAYRAAIDLSQVDLVIGVVDPCTVSVARERGIRAVCVTDHLWHITMRETVEQVSPPGQDVSEILARIGTLYTAADRLYLWPEPISPEDPCGIEAKRLCGDKVSWLNGVLESPDWDPGEVKRHYGVDNGAPTVFISTGALGPFQKLMDNAKNEYTDRPPQGYNVILDRAPAIVFLSGQPGSRSVEGLPVINLGLGCVLGFVRGGGGVYNSLIGARCACVTIAEPRHPQVNAIARRADEMGLTRFIKDYDRAAARPRTLIEQELARAKENAAIQERMRSIPCNAERDWAKEIVEAFLV